jgi:hypothetical protein
MLPFAAMKSTSGIRVAGLVLALIGLGPLLWVGATSGQLRVLRLAMLDPALLIAVCVLAASMAPARVRSALAVGRTWLMAPTDGWFQAGVFAWVIALSCAFAWYCFGGQPIITDELTQSFQGRILLSGHFAARGEPLREFFEAAQTVRIGDRWFAEFPIGGPALSALGELIRLPWIVNPLISALTAIGIYRFARRAFGETSGRIATLLFALSPFVLFMAGSRMNHVATLGSAVIALAGLSWWTNAESERDRQRAAALIGVGIGLMTLFRPYDAVLIALPVGLFQLWVIRGSPSIARSLPAQIVAALLVTSIQLLFNWKTTGHPFQFGYDALNGAAHRPGFHDDPWGRPFTPTMGARWIGLYLIRLNATLFESAIPAMVFVAGALLLIRRVSRWDWLMVGITFSVVLGYGSYWFLGAFVGPRFLYVAIPAFIVLAARFVDGWRERGDGVARRAGLLALPLSVLLAWLPIASASRSTGVWVRAAANRVESEPRNPDIRAGIRAAGLTNALVFAKESFHRRLAARLRALGMPPYQAERVVGDYDACALMDGLNASDASPRTPAADRLANVLERARAAGRAQTLPGFSGLRSLALVNLQASSRACAEEIGGDAAGATPFEAFLALLEFDRTGRLGGNVVFARDLGPRNDLLREQFGDRKWYRYRRDSSAAGIRAVFDRY